MFYLSLSHISVHGDPLLVEKYQRTHSLAANAKSIETEGHKEEREGRNEAQAQLRKKETQEERTEPEGQDKGLSVQAIRTPSSPQQAETLTILYNPTAANLMNN